MRTKLATHLRTMGRTETGDLKQHHLQAAIPIELWRRVEGWRNGLIGNPSVRQTVIALLEAGLLWHGSCAELSSEVDAP